jgi:hypothetical protein
MAHDSNNIMSHIYDAEFHPLLYTSPDVLSCRKWIKFFIYLIVIMFMISFTITDLIYGCAPDKCILQNTDHSPMTLSAWFQFSGIIGLMTLVFAISFGCCWSLSPSAHLIVNMIPQLMMFSWLIVGNVVYWKTYYHNNICDSGIIAYLMIRFYVGFPIVIISVYHEIKSYD